MDLNVFDIRSAINNEIIENSNLEYYPNEDEIEYSIKKEYFPHLNYFYLKESFDIFKRNNFNMDSIIKKKSKNLYQIYLNNKTNVRVINKSKEASNFPFLKEKLKKIGFRLEEIIDLEFFEYFDLHEKYLEELNLDYYSDSRVKLDSFSKLIYNFREFNIHSFESVFFKENPIDLIDCLNENDPKKISKESFTSFMDTEKIHLQFAKISKGIKKNIPVLVYYGYGNYYPFTQKIKNKNCRFDRFSMINYGDEFNSKYFEKEFLKDKNLKSKELIEKLDYSQQNYYEYFKKNFNLDLRRKLFIEKYGNPKFSKFIDSILMINPIIRTKSSALIAKEYFENKGSNLLF